MNAREYTFGYVGDDGTTEEFKCPAPDASNAEKKSSAIGEPPDFGLKALEGLTQLHKSSVSFQIELMGMRSQLNDLTKGMEYLAQQVKTLVDALAEEEGPDMPMTNYLSGKPV